MLQTFIIVLSLGSVCAIQTLLNKGILHSVNPESSMNVPQMIRYWGYSVEEHSVTTEDGYILTLHRIPHSKKESHATPGKPVIFMQHGLLCSSADWLVNPPNGSLGYLLADAGFDVWMGNSRGNVYSLNHTTLSHEEDEYWKFTWDDMAKFDLPAFFSYIEKVTSQRRLHYVGHSQGTMTAFAEFSSNQLLSQKVKQMYALAPVAFLKNMKSPMKYLTSIIPVKWFFWVFGKQDFLPSTWWLKYIARHMCSLPVGETFCSNVAFVICGYDTQQMNSSRLDVYMTHAPAGTSVQNIVHYAQGFESGKFQKYDFGSDKRNTKHYKQSTPPQYNLTNFRVPVHLYTGGNDWLADAVDVKELISRLPRSSVLFSKNMPAWMHLDFIWGMDARQEVYDDIIEKALASV